MDRFLKDPSKGPIKLLKFHNGMTVKCPLALFTGQLNTSDSSSHISVTRDDILIKWPVLSGSFKCLVPLKEGSNLISFETDRPRPDTLEIHVIYQQEKNNLRLVRLLYLVCRDEWGKIFERGTFQSPPDHNNSVSSAKEKISLAALMLQTFFSQTIPFVRTFALEFNDDGLPLVHVFRLEKTQSELWSLKAENLWRLVAESVLTSSLADPNCKYLAFCSFSRYICGKNVEEGTPPRELKQMTKGFVYLGGGNLALLSTTGLFSWPNSISEIVSCFGSETKIDRSELLDDSGRRGTFGGCYANTLGACAHELGHIFDLGHSHDGIMSSKCDEIESFFRVKEKESIERLAKWWNRSSSLILAYHKWFNDHSDTVEMPFTLSNSILKSRYGVVALEYRESDGLVTHFEDFYQSPKWIKLKPILHDVLLVAIDEKGNIFKAELTPIRALNNSKQRAVRCNHSKVQACSKFS